MQNINQDGIIYIEAEPSVPRKLSGSCKSSDAIIYSEINHDQKPRLPSKTPRQNTNTEEAPIYGNITPLKPPRVTESEV